MAQAIEEKEERLKSHAKAVVVGVGAEDGLGAALSRCYAANDRHVLVAGRSSEKVEKVAAAIRPLSADHAPTAIIGCPDMTMPRALTSDRPHRF